MTFVLDRLCTPEMLGPNLITPLRQLFDDLDGPALAEFLVDSRAIYRFQLPGRTR